MNSTPDVWQGTLALTLFRGREFEPREMEVSNAAPVAIISQSLADRMWPGEDAIGRSIQFPGWNPKEAPTVMTVVGVAATIQWRLFDEGPRAEIYVPYGQAFESGLNFHVRVAPGVNPKDVMAGARNELRKFDPQIPITNIITLAAMHRNGPWVRVARLGSMLFGAFGGLGVFLRACFENSSESGLRARRGGWRGATRAHIREKSATEEQRSQPPRPTARPPEIFSKHALSLLGIYGLKAYAVARRAREIGIRMALGATRRAVTSMILGESLWLALPGVAVGIALAVVVAKFSSPFLYHVRSVDPETFGTVPLVLLVVVLLACWFPARRAAKVDPMEALRSE